MKTTDVEFSLNNDSSCLYKDSTLVFDRIFQSENKKIRQRDKRLRSGINSTFQTFIHLPDSSRCSARNLITNCRVQYLRQIKLLAVLCLPFL